MHLLTAVRGTATFDAALPIVVGDSCSLNLDDERYAKALYQEASATRSRHRISNIF
jgi:hypothetical protein